MDVEPASDAAAVPLLQCETASPVIELAADKGADVATLPGFQPASEQKDSLTTDQPVKPTPLARQVAVTAVRRTRTISSGSWLPLAQDKVRNNIRLRPLLAGVYTLATLLIVVLLVLAWSAPVDNDLRLKMTIPPSPVAVLGVQWPLWSAQVVNGQGQGFEGVTLYASMTPVNQIDLVTRVDAEDFLTRSVNCINLVIQGSSATNDMDLPLCSPGVGNFLGVSFLTTDTNGRVVFKDMALTHGYPTNYLLILYGQHERFPGGSAFLKAFVKVVSPQVNLQVTSTTIPSTNLITVGSAFSVTATATWLGSKALSAGVVATVVPLDLMRNIRNAQPASVPFSPMDATRKGTYLSGAYSALTADQIVALGGSVLGYLQADFTFNVTLLGSNTAQLHLGVYMFGTIVTIQPLQLTGPNMIPHTVIPALGVVTDIATPTAKVIGGSLSSSGVVTVQEGSTVTIVVSVKTTSGRSAGGRTVFAMLDPDLTQCPSIVGSGAVIHPGANPKTISVGLNHFTTDDSGQASLPFIISATGGVGVYALKAVVDGVQATWPSGSTTLLLNITSSIAVAVASIAPAPWLTDDQEYEVTTKYFVRPPTVTLYDVNGNPVSGKYATLSVLSPVDQASVSAPPLVSNEFGVASFSSVVVPFSPSYPVNITFGVWVDGRLFSSFTREVRQPVDGTSPVGSCVAFKPIGIKPYLYAAIPNWLDFLVVDRLGNPVPNASVLFGIIPSSLQQLGLVSSSTTNVTNAAGRVTFGPISFTGFGTQGAAFGIATACSNSSAPASLGSPETIMLTFLSRFRSTPSVTLDFPNRRALIDIDAIWEEVTPSAPLVFELTTVWQPAIVSQFYYALGATPATNTISVVNQTHQVQIVLGTVYPGTCVVAAVADGTYLDYVLVNGALPVAKLVLQKSAFASVIDPNGTSTQIVPVNAGARTPNQAEVALLDVNGNAVDSGVIYAEAGIVNVTSGDVEWLNLFANATKVSSAFIMGPVSTNGAAMPSVNASDGVAKMPFLTLVGAQPMLVLTLRYCYVSSLQITYLDNGGSQNQVTICVNEATRFVVPYQGATLMSLSYYTAYAVPGVALAPLTVTLTNLNGGTPALPLFQFVTAACYSSHFRNAEAWTTTPGAPNGKIITSQSRGTVVLDSLVFAPGTPDGPYVVLVVAGGVSSPVIIYVSSQVAQLVVTSPLQNVAAGATFTVTATALGTSGQPIAGRTVQLRVLRMDSNCSFSGCGALSSASATFGKTDSDGSLSLPLSFADAVTGDYFVAVEVVTSLNEASLGQLVRRGVKELTDFFGTTQVGLTQIVATVNPFANGMLSVVLALLNVYDVSTVTTASATDIALLSSPNLAPATPPSPIQRIKASLAALFTSIAGGVSAQAATTPFTVWNPIGSIAIIRQPSFSTTIEQQSESFQTLVGQTNYFTSFGDADAPVVLVLKLDGSPAKGVYVDVEAVPSGVIILSGNSFPTDNEGKLSLAGVKFQIVTDGTVSLHFSVMGGFGNTTATGVQVSFTRLGVVDTMKTYSWIIAAAFAPMFLASVPHTRIIYTAAASALTIGLFIGVTVYVSNNFTTIGSNFFVQAYFVAVCIYCAVVMITQVTVAVIDYMSRVRRMKRWRLVNDEARARKQFEYAQWLTTVRIDKQVEVDLETVAPKWYHFGRRINTAAEKARTRVERKVEKLDAKFELELIDRQALDMKRKGMVRRATERPPLKTPPHLTPAFLPFNLVLVFGVACVLTMVNIFFVWYLYLLIEFEAGKVLNYIPTPPPEVDLSTANEALVEGLSAAMVVVAQLEPSLSFLANLAQSLQGVNVLGIIDSIRDFIADVLLRLRVAFSIGTTVSTIVVAGTIALTSYVAPRQILAIRRRQLTENKYRLPTVSSIEPYVGVHAWHFLVLFHALLWPTILVVLLASITMLRVWIWDKIWVAVVASVGSLVISLVISNLVVNVFLIDGWRVIRPEIYAVYSFMDLILGLFAGLIRTAIRYAEALAFVAAAFAKLDESIFPRTFQMIDTAHRGFCSVLGNEAASSNPVMLLFTSCLVLHHRLRVLEQDHGVTQIEYDTLGEDGELGAATMVNFSHLWLRWYVGASLDVRDDMPPGQTYFDVQRYNSKRSYRRVAHRFWMWWILICNPSLRRSRKHRVWVTKEEAETSGWSGESALQSRFLIENN